MRHVTVRQMRALLPEIEAALRLDGEIVLTRHGRAIAKLLPVQNERPARPSNQDLRAMMQPQAIASEVLIREDRDARG